jgi:hypothetical protein
MTIFYSQKSRILPFFVAILFLMQPLKMTAQNKSTTTPQIYTIPGITATLTTEYEPGNDASDGVGKLLESEPPPDPNFVLPAPPNDNCANATIPGASLVPGGSNICSGAAAMMGNATVEPGENVSCFTPAPTGTIWYSFIADQSTMWISVKPNPTICATPLGTVPSSYGLAVYKSNACFTAPVACLNYYSAKYNLYPGVSNILSKLNLTGLTIGSTYLIQVAWYASCSGNTWKPHCIRIGHPTTCTTCATNCGPMCVWAGPPPTPGDITSTCPSYPWAPPLNAGDSQTNCFSFTAANDTVWLQQIVSSYCNPNTISFTYNLYDAACGLIQSGNVFVNNLITPLTVGTTYKICYSMTAACTWDDLFWPYAYTTSSTLPVELVSFGAAPEMEKVKVFWSTASEENAKEFIIEKTRNGMDFTEVTHVPAAGNSTVLLNYKGYDDNPLTGNNYYRLKQVDFNGKFTYTKLVTASYQPTVSGFSIVPNPAKDKAKIAFNSSGSYASSLKITGMDGKVILNREFISDEGRNEYIIDMDKMSKGIYSVQLILADQNKVSKLVKD